MDRREMKKRMKRALGSLLLSYGNDWASVPNFWKTLEWSVFEVRNAPPTEAEKRRFERVRIELMWELSGRP